jgi:hypothetical protein
MGRKLPLWLLPLALAQTVLAPGAVALDWVTVNPLNLELLMGYSDFRHEEVSNDNRDSEWEVGLRVEQEGYIEHPGILSFRYTLEPRYYNGEWTATTIQGRQSEDTSRNFLGYSINIDALRESILPVAGGFDAAQSSQVLTGSLGRRTETDASTYGAVLNWKFDPFPMSFDARQTSTSSVSTRASGSPFLRDEVRRTFRIRGDSSKTRLRLEARSLDDRVPGRNNDFESYLASLNHHLPWGRASYLDSSIDYFKRTGQAGYDRFQLRELASVHHTESLRSEINYFFGLTRQTVDTTRNVGAYRIRHKLYRNLQTSAALGLEKHTSGNSELDRKLAGLEVSYQKANLFGVDVGLFLGANFSNNSTESRVALLEVVDESYTVPVSGLIILRNRFILAETIRVSDTSGAIVYVEGQDYLVEDAGDNLTQLSIIPGGLIEVGDVILVSYKAAALPPREYDRLATTASLRLGYRGFSLSHSDDKLEHTVISGSLGSLADTRNKATRLTYSWSGDRTSLQLGAERRFFRNGEFESTIRSANQSVGFRLTTKTRIGLGLTQAFTETNAEDVEVYSGHLDLTWRPGYNLSIRPALSAWKRMSERTTAGLNDEIAETDDTVLAARLSVQWNFRKLSFDLTATYNDRTLEQFPQPVRETTDSAFRAYLRRRF